MVLWKVDLARLTWLSFFDKHIDLPEKAGLNSIRSLDSWMACYLLPWVRWLQQQQHSTPADQTLSIRNLLLTSWIFVIAGIIINRHVSRKAQQGLTTSSKLFNIPNQYPRASGTVRAIWNTQYMNTDKYKVCTFRKKCAQNEKLSCTTHQGNHGCKWKVYSPLIRLIGTYCMHFQCPDFKEISRRGGKKLLRRVQVIWGVSNSTVCFVYLKWKLSQLSVCKYLQSKEVPRPIEHFI